MLFNLFKNMCTVQFYLLLALLVLLLICGLFVIAKFLGITVPSSEWTCTERLVINHKVKKDLNYITRHSY